MKLPRLQPFSPQREVARTPGGYNASAGAMENEFAFMQNMCSDAYPTLTTRGRRGRVRTIAKPNGLIAAEKLCWVDGTGFYYDGVLKGSVSDSEKQLAAMGSYILIWPDAKYYNSQTDEFGALGADYSSSGAVTFGLCKPDGEAYGAYTTAAAPPASPNDGALWCDTSSTPHALKRYSDASGAWISVPTTYVKLEATGIADAFSKYDGVSISGAQDDTLNGEFVIMETGENYIVVTALIDEGWTQNTPVRVERKIPALDFITQSENRLWGCSNDQREIYASKQGDPKNWNCFMGISTDSYAMSVGSPGEFTGACTHMGYVMLFKEDLILKLYGNKPANYQLAATNARGVERGGEKTLARVNETLLYKSPSGVCAYGASLPMEVSGALGERRYSGVAAGALGSKYYISLREQATGAASLFVCDTARNIWHREDGVCARWFARLGRELYFIDGENVLWSVGGSLEDYGDANAALEEAPEWVLETGELGLTSPDAAHVERVQLTLEAGSGAAIELCADGGAWREWARIAPGSRKKHSVRIIPVRCATFKLRLSGRGEARLYSMVKTLGEGSDIT